MATQQTTDNGGITKEDRNIIVSALNQLEGTYNRRANGKGVDEEEKELYTRKAAQVAATRNRLTTGALFK